jgi:hypothetical protein
MENLDLRARVAIYAEALRQLTLDNAAPWDNLNADARIRHIHATGGTAARGPHGGPPGPRRLMLRDTPT